MKKVRVGIIGMGLRGQEHLKIYSQLPEVEVVAVSDIIKEKIVKISKEYNVSVYTDYIEMLEKEDLDAVSITTPDHLHKDPVIESAKAGKHILCEKPLATTIKDAEEMVSTAKKYRVKLMVNFFTRWLIPYIQAKEKIYKGDIGKPLFANSRTHDTVYVPTKMLSWASYSSVLFFLMSHTVDEVRWLLNDEVSEVYATSTSQVLRSMNINTSDYCQAILKFKGGASALLEASWILPTTFPTIAMRCLEIVGEKGCIFIDTNRHRALEIYTNLEWNFPWIFSGEVYGKYIGADRESISHFIKCIIQDKEPLASGEDGLAVTKILCAIQESLEKNKIIKI